MNSKGKNTRFCSLFILILIFYLPSRVTMSYVSNGSAYSLIQEIIVNALYSKAKVAQPTVYIAPDGHIWGMTRASLARKNGIKNRYLFWTFPPPWQLFVHTVSLLPPETVAHVRNAYKDIRRDFMARAQALVARDVWKQERMHAWQVHHMVPVALGGGNELLALMRPDPHSFLHRFLDAQTLGMVPYESRTILIPICKGIVWNLSPTIKRTDKPVLPVRKNGTSYPLPIQLEQRV